MITVNQCFKQKVIAKDDELGLFVNLIFDRESYEARMVVFPKLKSRKRGLAKSLGSIGSRAFSSMSYDLSSAVGSTARGVITDVVYEATKKIDEKRYDIEKKLAYQYFLLPVSEITRIDDDQIILDKTCDEYAIFMNMKGTKSDVAFLNDELYREPSRYSTISLNLTSIRGINIKDSEKHTGRIVDAVFNPEEGTIAYFAVTTLGKGAKKRFIPLNNINLMEMTISKKFEDCPLIIPRSSNAQELKHRV